MCQTLTGVYSSSCSGLASKRTACCKHIGYCPAQQRQTVKCACSEANLHCRQHGSSEGLSSQHYSLESGLPSDTACAAYTAVSKGQQSEPQLSRSPPAPVALPPIRGPQPLPTTSSEVPALVEVSEAQPAASDPMSSAAATAQLLLALSSSKSPGGQLQQGTGLATVQLLRQGQASQEDQEQLSPRKLPPISHPSAKRRCIGSQEPPKAPPVLAVDMHRPPCSAREQAQHGPVPVTHPVASKQSHSVEGAPPTARQHGTDCAEGGLLPAERPEAMHAWRGACSSPVVCEMSHCRLQERNWSQPHQILRMDRAGCRVQVWALVGRASVPMPACQASMQPHRSSPRRLLAVRPLSCCNSPPRPAA